MKAVFLAAFAGAFSRSLYSSCIWSSIEKAATVRMLLKDSLAVTLALANSDCVCMSRRVPHHRARVFEDCPSLHVL